MSDIKRFFGMLVGAAVVLPYGIKEVSAEGLSKSLDTTIVKLIETLVLDTIVVLGKGEDPYYYGLLTTNPADIPITTPFGCGYDIAPEATRMDMMAWAVIKDAAIKYIGKVKGGLADD